jgi:hypothetical protein
MATTQFMLPYRPAYDSNGKMLPGAQLWFTLEGTDTPATIYSDAGLTTPLTNPVVANGVGRFSPIYFNDAVSLRVRLYTADAEVGTDDPEEEYDPFAAGIEDTALREEFETFAGNFELSAISSSASAVDNVTTLNAEIAALSTAGGGVLTIAAGTYPGTGAIVLKDDVTIIANGVTITGLNPYLYHATAADNWHVEGLQILATDASNQYLFRCFYATNWSMRNVQFRKQAGIGGGFIGLLIGGGYGTIDGISASGSNGIWIEHHDLNISNGEFTAGSPGGDDCLVIKASYPSALDPRTSSYNINISNCVMTGYAAMIAIGSEIGAASANDATYSRYVSGVTASNLTGVGCAYGLFIKPGANSGNDYRDGTVEGVIVSNLVMMDYTGTRMKIPVHILAGRGARVRNIKVNGVTVIGRFLDQVTENAGVYIGPYDYTGGTAATTIEELELSGFTFKDYYTAEATGGATPGYPLDWGVFMQRITGGGGTVGVIGRVTFEGLNVDGCRRSAGYLGTGITGPIRFRNTRLKNFNRGGVGGSEAGAFSPNSKIIIEGSFEATPHASAPVGTRSVVADGFAPRTTEIVGERAIVPIGDLAAAASTVVYWPAPRDSHVMNIKLLNGANIAQDATNKITFTVTNTDGTVGGAMFTADTHSATGGAVLPVNYSAAAETLVSLNGTSYLRVDTQKAEVPKDKMVKVAIASGGTAVLTDAYLEIEYVPYGAA